MAPAQAFQASSTSDTYIHCGGTGAFDKRHVHPSVHPLWRQRREALTINSNVSHKVVQLLQIRLAGSAIADQADVATFVKHVAGMPDCTGSLSPTLWPSAPNVQSRYSFSSLQGVGAH